MSVLTGGCACGSVRYEVSEPFVDSNYCHCTNCGSALFSRDPETKKDVGVRLGTVDGEPGIRPLKRQFVDYAAIWERVPDDGLPRHSESSRGQ